MKVLKKVISVILVGAMLLSNSQGLVTYANENVSESEVEKRESSVSEKITDITALVDLSAGNFNVKETNADTTPPEFRGVSVNKKVVKPGDEVTVSIDMIDTQSGVDTNYVYVELMGENYNRLPRPDIVYNKENNKFEFTIKIDGTMLNGSYSISEISTCDQAGNYIDFGSSNADLSGSKFEVVESINDYKEVIKSVTIDNKTPKVGDTINVSLELANNSHINSLIIEYFLHLEESRDLYLEYNQATNRYEGQLNIDEYMECGIWSPGYVYVHDDNGEYIKKIDGKKIGLMDKLDIEVVSKEDNDNSILSDVVYKTHVEDYGWQEWKSNGQMSGTSGEAKRLEAIEIKADNLPEGASIKYRTHVEDYGWQEWKSNGEMSGTSGEAKRLEAIEIKLENAPGYSVQYRTHVEDYGWQEWKSNGQMSGTSGEAKRLEAIEIRIVKDIDVEYRTHVEDYGWQEWKSNGQMSGTSGEAKRLEAIEIISDDLPEGASIKYRTHVEDYGWQEWKTNGEMAGTSGEAKRLEGIEIKLENAPGYSIQYRTHVEDYGWQEWKSDGEMSGTSGEAKRLEAIEVRIIKK